MRAIRHSEGILGREFSTFNTEFLQFSVASDCGARTPPRAGRQLGRNRKALTDLLRIRFQRRLDLQEVFYSAELGGIYRLF
jgi:hypothetical protein